MGTKQKRGRGTQMGHLSRRLIYQEYQVGLVCCMFDKEGITRVEGQVNLFFALGVWKNGRRWERVDKYE